MKAAIARRLHTLEKRTVGTDRPIVAFVLWERSLELVEAAYVRALATGEIPKGSPVIRGVMPPPTPLPANRWTDGRDLTDSELTIIALSEGPPQHQAAAIPLSDTALTSAIIASSARYGA